MDALTLWRRYRDNLCECPTVGLSLDISRMKFDDEFFARMAQPMEAAYAAMDRLEAGEIANPDENRMVGHYWLRDAHRAPSDEIRQEIEATLASIRGFAGEVHDGTVRPPDAAKFTELLLIGIGGSALGPQLVADALGSRKDKLNLHFMDNTDPDGFDRVFADLGGRVKSTLVLVVSKSGTTPETRNGMIEAIAFFAKKDLDFAKHAVAITLTGSKLHQQATNDNWLRIFPMWDWVGGRTSVMSAVGLLPMALQGIDIHGLLEGAHEMDRITRQHDTRHNPAALMALMWHLATGGKGEKDMVVLPYKDRLLLLSRYLQQLIMESLGKEKDLDGNIVHQGLAVYGNKGSTDQHAYVQQLRDGVANFFVTFLVVMQDRASGAARSAPEVEQGATAGDFLNGFWQGTRTALFDSGRESMTLTLQQLDARSLGAIVALYERAVGFYASLVNINAYHQPGVEAGKKAAATVLDLQRQVVAFVKEQSAPLTAEQIADRMGRSHDVETIFHILDHLAANHRGVAKVRGKFRWKA